MENTRMIIQAVIMLVFSFAMSAAATAVLLPLLRKLKAGQSIREEGPKAHLAKSGTPTMGGIATVIAFCVILLVGSGVVVSHKDDFGTSFRFIDSVFIAVVTLIYAAIGFIDDYIKVIRKRNLGLTAKQKIALQIVAAIVVAVYGGVFSRTGTFVYIPFVKAFVNFGWLYYPFVIFVVLAMTNAVNLTDGLDGLASAVTSMVAAAFALASGFAESELASVCLLGACMGFLLFNRHPAKLFMGDTGSLALGGALAAIAIASGKEFILPIAGLIYVLEALSVIIQVFVFKTQNGRRFFRMAPLHHHFELGGMSEVKVVCMFTLVTAVMGAIVVLLA